MRHQEGLGARVRVPSAGTGPQAGGPSAVCGRVCREDEQKEEFTRWSGDLKRGGPCVSVQLSSQPGVAAPLLQAGLRSLH